MHTCLGGKLVTACRVFPGNCLQTLANPLYTFAGPFKASHTFVHLSLQTNFLCTFANPFKAFGPSCKKIVRSRKLVHPLANFGRPLVRRATRPGLHMEFDFGGLSKWVTSDQNQPRPYEPWVPKLLWDKSCFPIYRQKSGGICVRNHDPFKDAVGPVKQIPADFEDPVLC